MSLSSGPEPYTVMALHASAVFNSKKAVVFLGPSGTGKTTIVQRLENYTNPLALDAVYILQRDRFTWDVAKAEYKAYGASTWADFETMQGVELYAIVRLSQSLHPNLRQIRSLKTARYLTDAFFEIRGQDSYPISAKKAAFTNLSTIAKKVPGYEFDFDLSFHALDLLNKTIVLW
jgi:ABC-type cobalamin/Fe3+-siderophores transport system ATPase subunit